MKAAAIIFISAIILSFGFSCSSGSKGHAVKNTAVKIERSEQLLAGRLFETFVSLNNRQPESVRLFNEDAVQIVTKAIHLRYTNALSGCANEDCLVAAFIVRPEEREILTRQYRKSLESKRSPTANPVEVGGLVKGKVGEDKIGSMNLDKDLLAVNYIFSAYLGNQPLRYPKIDGKDFQKNDKDYFQKILAQLKSDLKQNASDKIFFALPMVTALNILKLNGRDEASRYEPITAGINKEAFAKVGSVDFTKYQYSAILVPGLGPAVAGLSLDPGGIRRCELAVAQYKKGVAPFIIVSGGHVHPNKTSFSEGVEMKKYLVEKMKIPSYAVIAEPYARHTTTNIRNAVRIIYSFNMPVDKPVLIVSDAFQSSYILMMKGRFMEELGYLPYKELKQSGDRKPYFVPDLAALQTNPYDPLDP